MKYRDINSMSINLGYNVDIQSWKIPISILQLLSFTNLSYFTLISVRKKMQSIASKSVQKQWKMRFEFSYMTPILICFTYRQRGIFELTFNRVSQISIDKVIKLIKNARFFFYSLLNSRIYAYLVIQMIILTRFSTV